MKTPTYPRFKHAFPQVFAVTFAAALLAGCGGSPIDAPDASGAPDASASAAGVPSQAAAAATPKRTLSPDSLTGVVRAGAATTQETIDRALAAHAAAQTADNRR